MCVFPCWLPQHHQYHVMYYFLSLPSCFFVLWSLFLIVALTWLLPYIVSYFLQLEFIPIRFLCSFGLSLSQLYVFCNRNVFVNKWHKCVGEIQNSTKVDMVVGSSTEGSTIFFVVLVQTLGTVAANVMSSVC